MLTPEQVKRLSALRPMRVVSDTVMCWAVIFSAWVMVAVYPAWWTVLLAIPLIGSRFYGLFIIGHDGLHGRLLENRQWNNRFADIFIFGAIGAITRINNKNHLLHHLNLSNPDDPDRHKHGCFNKSDRSELTLFVMGLGSILKSVGNVFVKNSRREGATSASGQAGYTASDILLLAGWQTALFCGLTFLVAWWAYPVLWLLPVYAFTFLGDNLRSFAEHSHPEGDEKADEHRLITYASNPIERWFLAPMNMNFHAAHHLWVSIPYYNLPEADRLMRGLMQEAGRTGELEWRKSYLGYLMRYGAALPLQECKMRAESV